MTLITPQAEQARREQFLRLFAEVEPALRTFVHAMLPGREDVSEVMQEAAGVLWQKFESALDFRKWAFGVTRNMALRHRQAKARDRHVFDDELVNRLADEAIAMERRHEAQREAFDDCLQKLPFRQRELALAAYAKGARIDEIAAGEGRTPMSLYKVLHRIRQALLACVRRALAQEEPA